MLVAPVFVFQPGNAQQLGLPPAYMTRSGEARDFQSTAGNSPALNSKRDSLMGKSKNTQSPTSPKNIVAGELQTERTAEFDEKASVGTVGMPVHNKEQPIVELSEHEKSINLMLQFID